MSGDEDAFSELKERLEDKKIFVRPLQVEQALHSHYMVPLVPGFTHSSTPGFASKKRHICLMVSNATARDSNARPTDAAYWVANIIGVVRYPDVVTGIALNKEEQNVNRLVEFGAHQALEGPSRQFLKNLKPDIPYVTTLRRDTNAFESLLATAGQPLL
ncbi:hypothetical protein QQS21_011519 [Conoideocrella luteorostrata]|uniref:Malonyl-CoA:ACP transacylase (MAT) domain-containing protein n=1 Tax=Conoideocrella luteorostrata TaxID=1105319 RepID=A0AAJ0CCY9_9HYPO|nr:hypothetical protein QQS21_011519 [Conoideocrella luteorostrata]